MTDRAAKPSSPYRQTLFVDGEICLSHCKGSFYELCMEERQEFFLSAVDQAYLDWARLKTGQASRVSDETPVIPHYEYLGPVDYLAIRLFNWMGLTAGFYLCVLGTTPKYSGVRRLAYNDIVREWAHMSISLPEEMESIIVDLMGFHLMERPGTLSRPERILYFKYREQRDEILSAEDV